MIYYDYFPIRLKFNFSASSYNFSFVVLFNLNYVLFILFFFFFSKAWILKPLKYNCILNAPEFHWWFHYDDFNCMIWFYFTIRWFSSSYYYYFFFEFDFDELHALMSISEYSTNWIERICSFLFRLFHSLFNSARNILGPNDE